MELTIKTEGKREKPDLTLAITSFNFHSKMLALKCLQLKFEIVLSINLTIQSYFGRGFEGVEGGGQDPHWIIQTYKIYIKLPKIGLGNHRPSSPFANLIPRTTFRIHGRSLQFSWHYSGITCDHTQLVRSLTNVEIDCLKIWDRDGDNDTVNIQ